MTTVATVPAEAVLSYEAYMAEPEVEGRYDIIKGVRIFYARRNLGASNDC